MQHSVGQKQDSGKIIVIMGKELFQPQTTFKQLNLFRNPQDVYRANCLLHFLEESVVKRTDWALDPGSVTF